MKTTQVKSEFRNPKSERSPNSEARSKGLAWPQLPLGNGRKADFGLRISDFFRFSGIRFSGFGAQASLALAVVLASPVAFAQSNRIPGPQDYALFSHFITDRNIFDPNRVPHSYNPNQTRRISRTRRGTPGIQLVGTMSYEKGLFAFFSGNSSELSKVLQVGSKILDYTIMEIAPSFVVLESADKKEQPRLQVGDGFRQESGKWVLAKAGDVPAASGVPEATGVSDNSSASDTSAAPASAAEPNEVLKRLMEKRQKENQ